MLGLYSIDLVEHKHHINVHRKDVLLLITLKKTAAGNT